MPKRAYEFGDPIALDARDPDIAARELYEQLTRRVIKLIEQRVITDDKFDASPEAFADALAKATSGAIIQAFHIGRAWQSSFDQHEREHAMTHEGASNN